MALNQDIQRTRQSLDLICEPNAVYELRAAVGKRRIDSGYFDDLDALATAAINRNRKHSVWMTLNPVRPELLARACNRIEERAEHTTADDQILKRCWTLLDFDPVRISGVSSTDEEHALAIAMARDCRTWLCEEGIPKEASILADSGNGAHLLVRVDLPNDAASRTLVERLIRSVAAHFSTDGVEVDLTTGNASRLCKVYGTFARKGDSTRDRPHRLARLLEW